MTAATSVALLGCGRWGRLILRDLVAAGAEVHVWSISEASREAARSGGASSVSDDLAGLPDVAGVVIATSTSTHAACIDAVADRRVPIFVEKPMCADPEVADRLADSCGDRLFVMDKWRYHTGVLLLAEMARSGELGQIVGLGTTRIGYADNHRDVDAAWILAPHDLSIAYEVLGAVPPMTSAVGHVDDSGGVRELRVTMAGEGRPWFTYHVADRSPIERREIQLVGTEAVAVLDGGYADHVTVRRVATVEQRAFEPNMPLAAELAVFLQYLNGGPTPRTIATEAAATVRLIAEARSAVGARR